jgi:hypothetical protein
MIDGLTIVARSLALFFTPAIARRRINGGATSI